MNEPRVGYGRALAAGVRAVPSEADVVVFMDGDGSDDPAFIGALIAPIEGGNADFVLGSRTRGTRDPGSLSVQQILAGRFAGMCLRLLFGVDFTDVSPYRVLRRTVLDVMPTTEITYGWNLQMMILAAQNRLRIVEIPVHTRRRSGGVSKVSGNSRAALIAAIRILSVLARNALPSRARDIRPYSKEAT